ncbi:MAG: hypothetical protein ACKVTZ_02270 [Bacteroidia bacterium]
MYFARKIAISMLYFVKNIQNSLNQRPLLWLFALLLLEIGLFSFIYKGFGNYLTPLVLLLIPFVWCKVFLSFHSKSQILANNNIAKTGLFTLLGFLSIALLYEEFRKLFFGADYMEITKSDILPQIYYMVEYFLQGKSPYQPIEEIPWKVQSPYMPMHWLPFVLPYKLGIDFRWLPVLVCAIGVALYGGYLSTLNVPAIRKRYLLALPLVTLFLLIKYEFPFQYTVELLITSYYLILTVGLAKKSFPLQLIGICLALLSRFMLIFWLPVYLLTLFLHESKKKAMIATLIIIASISVFYVIPFWIKDPSIFQKGIEYHRKGIENTWFRAADTTDFNTIKHSGVGISSIVFEVSKKDHASLSQSISLMEKVHLATCLLVVMGLGFWYHRNREKIAYNHFLLLLLKINITLFIVFNPMPYAYYYLSSLVISWFLFAEIATKIPEQKATF